MGQGRVRQRFERDRPALWVIGIGSLLASIGWRFTTQPMVDTPGYRATIMSLENGWHHANDRLIGYPLIMMATGAGHGSSRVLFLLQLVLHAVTVLLVVDIGRRVGLGRWGAAAVAVLLYAPVVLLRVVQEGTECIATFQLTLAFWLLLTPPRPEHRVRWAVALGLVCGTAALVRPTFTLLFLPVMALAAWTVPAKRWRTAAAVALPALILVGGWVAINGIRFDLWNTTPNAAFNLNSHTSRYVERLPESYEPGRSVLIRHRDEALLMGDAFPPENYIYLARPDLEEATGLHDRDLEAYVMDVNLYLILHNPANYLDAVKQSALNNSGIDGSPAVLGLGRPVAQAQTGVHQVLLIVFLGAVALLPGLALAGRIARDRLRVLGVALALAGYTFLVTVMVEAGTPRLRAPSEPMLALVLVLALSIARVQVRDRVADRGK